MAKMTLDELDWHPHSIVKGIRCASFHNHHIVHGLFIRGYEVRDPQGNVTSGYTAKELEKFLNTLLTPK